MPGGHQRDPRRLVARFQWCRIATIPSFLKQIYTFKFRWGRTPGYGGGRTPALRLCNPVLRIDWEIRKPVPGPLPDMTRKTSKINTRCDEFDG